MKNQNSNTKVAIITAIITGITTISVASIGILPQIRKGDDENKSLVAKVDDLTAIKAEGDKQIKMLSDQLNEFKAVFEKKETGNSTSDISPTYYYTYRKVVHDDDRTHYVSKARNSLVSCGYIAVDNNDGSSGAWKAQNTNGKKISNGIYVGAITLINEEYIVYFVFGKSIDECKKSCLELYNNW